MERDWSWLARVSSRAPVCGESQSKQSGIKKIWAALGPESLPESFCGCLQANTLARKRRNCFAGESSWTRRTNMHAKCQGVFLNLWASAHLVWFHAALRGRIAPRTQGGEMPFTICNNLNGESWGGADNDIKRWPPVLRIHHNEHSVFKQGELAFPQKAFRHSPIIGSESKISRKSGTFPHWHSCIEKSTHGSKGNEKTQLVISSKASNLHFCDPSILSSSINRLFSPLK